MVDHTAVVIPTRNRHEMLANCVESVIDQAERVLIIDNGSDPKILPHLWGEAEWWASGKLAAASLDEDPPNISRLWNAGLDIVGQAAGGAGYSTWDVAVLNSDVVVPAGWMAGMSHAMRSSPAVLAYPDQFGGVSTDALWTRAEPVPLTMRITGYAHMHRGEVGLRYDESMAWWYSDDDMDWTAREQGGSLLVAGWGVDHLDPNGSTNARRELQEQAGRDRQTFINKWGRAPH